jgi:hypothetical protein
VREEARWKGELLDLELAGREHLGSLQGLCNLLYLIPVCVCVCKCAIFGHLLWRIDMQKVFT